MRRYWLGRLVLKGHPHVHIRRVPFRSDLPTVFARGSELLEVRDFHLCHNLQPKLLPRQLTIEAVIFQLLGQTAP